MSQEIIPARLTCLVAIDADKAVVLREKPSRSFQALLWDFKQDIVTPGQWLNAKIDTCSCDVSPDGRLMVIGAIDYRRHPPEKRITDSETKDIREWIAVSRPPFFSALTLFESTFLYGSGGVWLDNDCLVTIGAGSKQYISSVPDDICVMGGFVPREMKFLLGNWVWEGVEGCEVLGNVKEMFSQASSQKSRSEKIKAFNEAFFTLSTEKNEHRYEQKNSSLSKQFGRVKLWHLMNPDKYWITVDEKVLDMPFRIDWADFSSDGVLKFAGNGCLWTWPEAPNGEPILIADLTPNKFEKCRGSCLGLKMVKTGARPLVRIS